jgi:hypothetical protein
MGTNWSQMKKNQTILKIQVPPTALKAYIGNLI